MKALAAIAIALVAVTTFLVGMLVGRSSVHYPSAALWTGTLEVPSVLMRDDDRPVVELSDRESGIIDNWEVTAGFLSTDAEYGYGKRRIWFEVRVEWTGTSPPDEFMYYNFLEGSMLFTSPSGKTATVHLRRDSSDNSSGEDTATFSGRAYNGSDSLPDEPGRFHLTFGPHPEKQRLAWSVELPYLPLNGPTESP